MIRKADLSGLDAELQIELDMTASFIKLLQKEQEALIGANLEILETLPREKSVLVMQLTRLSNQRDQHLSSYGLNSDRKGMEALISRSPNAASVTVKWNELLRMAESAQQLNRTNGDLINTRLRYNQQALTVLQNATGGSAPLYGPTGRTFTVKGGRQFGQV